MRSITILVLLAFTCGLSLSQLTIYSPSEVAFSFPSIRYTFLGDQNTQELNHATFTFADPMQACSSLRNVANVSGTVVLVQAGSCSPQVKAKHIQEAGGIGIAITNPVRSWISAGFAVYDDLGVNILVVDVIPKEVPAKDEMPDLTKFMNDHPDAVLFGNLKPEENLSVYRSGYWIFYTIFFELLGFLCIGIASFKLFKFTQRYGMKPRLPQIVLIIEILTNIMRNILLPLEPQSLGRGIWSYEAQTFLYTLCLTDAFVADLMIAFYWQALIQQTKSLTTAQVSLKKLKIPFVIVCLIVLLADHIVTAMRMARSSAASQLIILSFIVYVISVTGVAAFFIITGIRIIKLLQPATSRERSKLTKRMTWLITGSGVGLLLTVIFAILIVGGPQTDSSVFAMASLVYFWYGISSLCQILIFIPPDENDSSPSTKQNVELTKTFSSMSASSVLLRFNVQIVLEIQ